MAGVRDHQTPSGSGPDRACPVSARRPSISGFGTRRRPLRPAQAGHDVLLRVCPELGPALDYCVAGKSFRSSDLRRGCADRRGARLQRASEPRPSAPVGARRAFSQRGSVERQHLPGCDDPGSIGRRFSVCILTRSVSGIRDRHAHRYRRSILHASNHTANPGAGARTRHLDHCSSRLPLHLEPQAGPGFNLARYVCRSTRRRRRPASGLCQRNS